MNDSVVNLSIAFVTILYIVMWAHNQFYSIFEQFHHFVHCQLSYEEAANASFEYETEKTGVPILGIFETQKLWNLL